MSQNCVTSRRTSPCVITAAHISICLRMKWLCRQCRQLAGAGSGKNAPNARLGASARATRDRNSIAMVPKARFIRRPHSRFGYWRQAHGNSQLWRWDQARSGRRCCPQSAETKGILMYVPPLQKDGDEALLFALEAALETFRFCQTKIQECDCCIQ